MALKKILKFCQLVNRQLMRSVQKVLAKSQNPNYLLFRIILEPNLNSLSMMREATDFILHLLCFSFVLSLLLLSDSLALQSVFFWTWYFWAFWNLFNEILQINFLVLLFFMILGNSLPVKIIWELLWQDLPILWLMPVHLAGE